MTSLTPGFLQWWMAGVVLSAICLRWYYSRDPKRAWVCMWIFLGVFLTPVGAIVLYLVLRALSSKNNVTGPAPVIEK